jgi:hypothetical protein
MPLLNSTHNRYRKSILDLKYGDSPSSMIDATILEMTVKPPRAVRKGDLTAATQSYRSSLLADHVSRPKRGNLGVIEIIS